MGALTLLTLNRLQLSQCIIGMLIWNSVQGIWVVYCKLGGNNNNLVFSNNAEKRNSTKIYWGNYCNNSAGERTLQHLMVFSVQLKFPLIFLKAASSDKLLAAPTRQSFNLNFNFQTSSWELNWNFLTIISWCPGAISGKPHQGFDNLGEYVSLLLKSFPEKNQIILI